jgi:LPS-assembly protein
MLNLFRTFSLLAFVLLAGRALAQAAATQPPPAQPPPAQPPAPESTISDRREGSNDQKDWHFIGHVEWELGGGAKVFADDVMTYTGEDRAIATGNVVFTQGTNRITAERADFNTVTRLGTFYNAWGMATVQPPKQTARPGAVAPPTMAGQETVVYFFGETIEKIAAKKYKITKGGFSTCVQPTPRWDLHAGTVILNIDHYTLLTQAVLTVKGVPMLYLPVMYYPTKRDGRATGFLIPTIGTSTLRGESIHDAFFWAIDRSQDATILHDFFSKVGQGVGTEYRYNFGPSKDGNISAYFLDQHSATYVQEDGTSSPPTEASKSFEIRGSANQLLPGNLHARANVSYPSSIAEAQTFNTNIYDTSRNQRTFGGNLVGAWGSYTLNATLNHNEYFYDLNNSALSGSTPQIDFNRSERPLFGSDLYFSATSEYAHLLRDSRSTDATTNITTDVDSSVSRIDVSPQIRYPFKKWQWFTVNSTVNWHDTYYSRIETPFDPTGAVPQTMTDEPLNRTVFSVQSQIVGPVFNRIWDTPGNGYAEKFKHSVEPYVTVQYTTPVADFQRIVQFDSIDSYVGGTRINYGINNRFYAKRQSTPGLPAQAREIFDVELTQTYYTNQSASAYDQQFATTYGSAVQTNFSAISLNIRAMPTNDINANVRADFDERTRQLETISVQGTYMWTNRVQTSLLWSKRGYIQGLPGFDDCRVPSPNCVPANLDHSISPSVTMHTKDNRVGTVYTFNYDVLHGSLIQQSLSAFYNAQCCGLAFQYQSYNFGAGSASPIPADHRFFLSFTLAGLGNFSPFNGAMSGVPR